jgi:hypothetical protein
VPRTLRVNPELQDAIRREIAGTIKHAMVRDDVSFRDLAGRLNKLGFDENERNLRNKVSKGEMQAFYYLLLLRILRIPNIPITSLPVIDPNQWDFGHETGNDVPWPSGASMPGKRSES